MKRFLILLNVIALLWFCEMLPAYHMVDITSTRIEIDLLANAGVINLDAVSAYCAQYGKATSGDPKGQLARIMNVRDPVNFFCITPAVLVFLTNLVVVSWAWKTKAKQADATAKSIAIIPRD
jgi:hypothetical protein